MNAITIAHLSDIHYAPSEISEVSTLLREKGVFVEKLQNTDMDGTFLMMHHPFLPHARHLQMNMNDRLEKILRSGKIKAIFNGHVHGSYTCSVFGVPQFTADSLKTCFDIYPDHIAYNNRAGYEIVSFGANGDWLTERFLLNPETETYFEK